MNGPAQWPFRFRSYSLVLSGTQAELQIREGIEDNFSYFSMKTYVATLIRTVSTRQF